MSLNGLDEAAVIEAHQAALAEPGGWFLLKYVTRDTIGLLQSGTGGVVEVRSAIEQYQEQAPVYGLVQYRRRKIVLKYVPEGTSRLFQARLTVQFQSVLERFTPYDTVYSFTAATEMTDSALSSACSLHTSIVSLASSTSSIQRRRLVEITEDTEEDGSERRKSGLRHSTLSNADSSFNEATNLLASQAPTTSNLLSDSHLPKPKGSTINPLHGPELHPIPVLDKSLPPNAMEILRTSVDGSAAVEEANGAIAEQVYPRFEDPWGSPQSRHSNQSVRPSALGLDRPSSPAEYRPYTPKIKLGPRPSTQRPRTRGSRAEARPVANMPNSVRISTRLPSFGRRPPSSAPHRPISQHSNRSAHSTMTNQYDSISPPPLPHPSVHTSALYQPANHYLLSRPASPTSSIAHSVATSMTSTAPSKITPEKLRLMRALELRKKQQMGKTCQTNPPIQPSSRQESLGTTQVTSPYCHSHPDPEQTKKDFDQDNKPQLIRDGNLSNQLLASSKIITPSILGAKAPAYESSTATERTRHPHIDPSLDGKNANLVPNLTEPGSGTSKSSRLSLEPTVVAPSMAPVRPPIEAQNTHCTGASSSSSQPDSGRLRETDPILSTTQNTEEQENMDAAVRLSSPQTQSAPPTAEVASPSSLVSQVESSIDRRPVVLNIARDLDSGFPGQRSGREGAVEPDNEVVCPEASDTSDDGSLYDEFQNATVEQAKPVMIARSGFNAVSNSSTLDRQRQPNRSVSSPNYSSDQDPKLFPQKAEVNFRHSLSSALPDWPPTGGPAQSMLINKPTVSSGISKRIRALEIFSGAGSSSPTAATPPTPPLTASLVQKRVSSQSPKGTVAHHMATSSTTTAKQRTSPPTVATPTSAQATAERRSSWLLGEGPRAEVLAAGRKGDSVSVTARIIRDSDMIKPQEPGGSSKPAAMSLHRSPLVVQHQKGYLIPRHVEPAVIPVGPRETEPTAAETSNAGRRRFSLSSAHSSSGKLPQPESLKKRLSMTIRHARSESGNLIQSASDPSSLGENKGVKEPRKKNRLRKRMSVLTAGSRRNVGAVSNAVGPRENAWAASQPPSSVGDHSEVRSRGMSSIAESHAHVVDIGDVNIQFPDTLLWKRRFMRIDNQGFLILTPPTMEPNNRGISRRFHLSDIKKPSLPTVEREELPWSIVLDFDDGSCLQCACESKYAQGQVLGLLTDAHAAYRSLYMQS